MIYVKSAFYDVFKLNVVCSSYGFKPSQKDLLDHMTLIGEVTKRDAVLARSKVCIFFLRDIVSVW
jgi:hypothetical protein